ncbi:MAG: hypothetical protein ACFFFB_11135 [Candidatus Heimdallarchaeota archaeon]
MFCPNCGEKLETSTQKFCAICGSEIQIPLTPEAPEVPSLPVEETHTPSPTPAAPIYETKPIKAGIIGSRSKISFSLSLVAIAFFIAGLSFGVGVIIRLFIPTYFIPYLPFGPRMWIIAFVLHIIGFIFGIISRVSCTKAGRTEPENALQKVGSVFSVFGIILNLIPLFVIPLASSFAGATLFL